MLSEQREQWADAIRAYSDAIACQSGQQVPVRISAAVLDDNLCPIAGKTRTVAERLLEAVRWLPQGLSSVLPEKNSINPVPCVC